jgi:hypothetical protein
MARLRGRHRLGVQLLEHSYQRNGICGEGFNACTIYLPSPIRTKLLATIGYCADGERLDPASCRVVDPGDLTSHWRGDQIGDELAQLLTDEKVRVQQEAEAAVAAESARANREYFADEREGNE